MFDFNPRRGSIAARAMKIRKLKLTNFRGLRDEDIDFDESITVFAGKNGGGKSTVLEAVAIMLSWLPARISNYAAAGRQIRTADITVGCDFSKLEMTLARENAHPGEEMKLTLFKRANKSGPDGKSDMSAARKFGDNTRVLLDSNGYNVEIPVFAYYGADRNTLGIPAPLPAAARTSIYANAFDAGVNFAKFSGWLASAIEKRRYEMEKLAGEPLKKANRLRGEINEHFAALAHIQKALRDFSEEFDGLYVENGRLWIKAKNIPADYLSEGEKTVAALLGDIALRMVVANPGMKNPLAAAAIVLIDELDLHLHPDWQTMLAEKLPRIFPNSQFIISSHSPSVISVTKNLYRLNASAHSGKFEKSDSQFGRSPADILSTVLNARREGATAAKISELYEAIDNADIQKAAKLIDELNAKIPDDPDVLRAEYIVRALSAENKK